jgi:hypothetical protein
MKPRVTIRDSIVVNLTEFPALEQALGLRKTKGHLLPRLVSRMFRPSNVFSLSPCGFSGRAGRSPSPFACGSRGLPPVCVDSVDTFFSCLSSPSVQIQTFQKETQFTGQEQHCQASFPKTGRHFLLRAENRAFFVANNSLTPVANSPKPGTTAPCAEFVYRNNAKTQPPPISLLFSTLYTGPFVTRSNRAACG